MCMIPLPQRADPPTPSSDTGSLAPPRPPEAHVDYVSATWPVNAGPEAAARMAYTSGLPWRPLPRGAMGYMTAQASGHATLFSDGATPDMGIHLQLKGEACEDAEADPSFPGWQTYLADLIEGGASLSRLDIALDDLSGALDLAEIQKLFMADQFTSRWRTVQLHAEHQRHSPDWGITFCFGRGGSQLSLRIYDAAHKHGAPAGTHWIRVELQARDAAADALAKRLATEGIAAVSGIIAAYLQFRPGEARSRRERNPVAGWWDAFLRSAEHATLALRKAKRTLERTLQWLERQAAPSLALARLALWHEWEAWFQRLLSNGWPRIPAPLLAQVPQRTPPG